MNINRSVFVMYAQFFHCGSETEFLYLSQMKFVPKIWNIFRNLKNVGVTGTILITHFFFKHKQAVWPTLVAVW
jgi:hypothetical protein